MAFSEVLENTAPPTAEAVDELRMTFDLAYSSAAADCLPARYHLIAQNQETACTSTIAHLMPEPGPIERTEQLGRFALDDCPKWANEYKAAPPIPGRAYGKARVLVMEKMVGLSAQTRSSHIAAFEGGYKAGAEDTMMPSADEVAKAVVLTCESVLRTFQTAKTSSKEVCNAVLHDVVQ